MKRLPLIALLVASTSLLAQEQTGAITGQVLAIDGHPAVSVRVAIVSADVNGKIDSDILAGITATDETGHYRIDNVPPGRYGIVAGAVSAPTFYPGTTNGSEAGLVTVERGSKLSGIDFTLLKASVPLPGSQGMLSPALQAQLAAQLNRQLALPGQMIVGKVVVDGPIVSAFLPNLTITLVRIIGTSTIALTPADILRGSGAGGAYSAATNVKPDGGFRLELKPMTYAILVGRVDNKPLEGFVVKSITLGSTNVAKDGLTVNGPVAGELVITLLPVPITGPIK